MEAIDLAKELQQIAALDASNPDERYKRLPNLRLKALTYSSDTFKEMIIKDDIPIPWLTPNPSPKLFAPRTITTPPTLFSHLPLEILRMILLALPYISLRSLMITCTTAWSAISNTPEYLALTYHAAGFLRILNTTSLLTFFPTAALHTVLTTSKCAYCPSFAGYVYLPGLVRCCVHCATHDRRFTPVPRSLARSPRDGTRAGYGLSASVVDRLPVMRTKGGMYFDRRVITKTLYLLSRPLVQEAMVGRNHAGGVRPPRYNVDEARGERVYRYMAIAPLPPLSLSPSQPTPTPLRCLGCSTFATTHRAQHPTPRTKACQHTYQDGTSTPFSPSAARPGERGEYWLTCAGDKRMQAEFLPREWEVHFRTCEEARAIWDGMVEEAMGVAREVMRGCSCCWRGREVGACKAWRMGGTKLGRVAGVGDVVVTGG